MAFRCSNSSRIADNSSFVLRLDELFDDKDESVVVVAVVGLLLSSTIVFRVSYSPRVVRGKNLTPRPIFDIFIIFAT